MQDGFLFDRDDDKQRGFRCDSLDRNNPKLKLKWVWGQSTRGNWKKRVPCQCSEANFGDGWTLKCVFWHTYYDANISRFGKSIGDIGGHCEVDSKKYKTRIECQIAIEKEFLRVINQAKKDFYK